MSGDGHLRLRPRPLTASASAPFGAVLAHDGGTARPADAGTAWRTNLDGFADRGARAAPALAVYRLAAQALPLAVHALERHPGSSRVSAALAVERFPVVVAPAGPDSLPDAAGARAFVGHRGTALRDLRGLWHAAMAALDAEGDMLTPAFERGTSGDTVEHRRPAALPVAD